MSSASRTRPGWTLAIVSIALFMTALDNLVVGVALPSIRADLNGSIESLEWTVNAYTLSFAVFLLTGAALGDRFGRKRMFIIGLGIFTLASAAPRSRRASRRSSPPALLQGFGADRHAAHAHPAERGGPREKRGLALGVWAGVTGLGVAMGHSSAAPSSRASRGTGSSGSTCPSASRCSRSRSAC